MLIHIPAAPLAPVQLVNTVGKAAEGGPNDWVLVTHVGDPNEAPGFGLAQCWPWQPSGKGTSRWKTLSLPLAL